MPTRIATRVCSIQCVRDSVTCDESWAVSCGRPEGCLPIRFAAHIAVSARRLLWVAFLLGPYGSEAADAPAADAPELIFTNARVHTQDAAHHVVAALAVRGNAVLATGSDADM